MKIGKEVWMKVGKVSLILGGAAITVIQEFVDKKEADEKLNKKVAEKVAEALADQTKES